MPVLATEAIVLHSFRYLESSRILRLVTRDAGVLSVIARGARRARSAVGGGVDLFAQGTAQLILKDGRDLHTLSAFDVARPRRLLGSDLARFTGAAVLAELVLRVGHGSDSAELFDTLALAFDQIATVPAEQADEAALSGAWLLVRQLGFAPVLDACSACRAVIPPGDRCVFSARAGGVLCARCAPQHAPGRALPGEARASIAEWSTGAHVWPLPVREARAHQRVLREFLDEHLGDGRPWRAFEAWEHGGWEDT